MKIPALSLRDQALISSQRWFTIGAAKGLSGHKLEDFVNRHCPFKDLRDDNCASAWQNAIRDLFGSKRAPRPCKPKARDLPGQTCMFGIEPQVIEKKTKSKSA